MPPGTVGTLAFCRVPWKPWAADTAFPPLRRVRRPKRCRIPPLALSHHTDTLPVVMTHPPRQPSGSRSRSQSADPPQDLLEPNPSHRDARPYADLHEPLPQVNPRPFRDRLGQRQVADQGLHIRASIDGHAEMWRAGVLSGLPSTPDSANRPAQFKRAMLSRAIALVPAGNAARTIRSE
jgi:hypothetical protein